MYSFGRDGIVNQFSYDKEGIELIRSIKKFDNIYYKRDYS
jgi:hypothetical protein